MVAEKEAAEEFPATEECNDKQVKKYCEIDIENKRQKCRQIEQAVDDFINN